MFGIFNKKKKIEGLMKDGMSRSQKRARVQTYKSYYEGKIKTLEEKKLSPPLLILACKDAPFEPGILDSKSKRNAYIRKCLKYYRQQLAIIEKEAKQLKIY
ncbi:MAG: hypothetical protein C0613_16175 [Desulfobulbaceae bacterium]|nr:MAG: hypothetical protein C0613_16175 [Desulfobulbaceae bacterium]